MVSALENFEAELRRGVLVLLVIAALVDENLHGMALMEKINKKTSGVINLPLGTLYPLLRRFINNEKMIETFNHPDDKRKTMYKLNTTGREFFKRARELWLRYSSATHVFIDSVDERNLR